MTESGDIDDLQLVQLEALQEEAQHEAQVLIFSRLHDEDVSELDDVGQDDAGFVQQMHIATRTGNVERVSKLLDQGADVDARLEGCTPLMNASFRGHCDIVNLLLDRGANINAVSGGVSYTSLISAAAAGHLDVVQILVDRKARVDQRDKCGCSALLGASMFDHLAVCVWLLGAGADLKRVNNSQDNYTPLGQFGLLASIQPSDADKALRCAALEAAWAEGPHPSQVQRRKEERWERRGPLLTVLAEHAYRPLRLRALAIALAAAAVDPAEPVVKQTSRMQDVCRHEGLVRDIVAFL